MEAKVDVRKLQVLNDRINQTIDALNQVRLSVHGLGHTGGLQSQINPFALMTQGYGLQQPYGMGVPGMYPGIGGQLGGLQQGLGGFPGIGGQLGMQHSPFQQSPFQQFNPFVNPYLTSPWSQIGTPFGSPFGQTASPWSFLGQAGGIGGGIPGGIPGLSGLYGGGGGGFGGGLLHSGTDVIERQLAEARANDPFRITQTFPFVVS